MSAIMYYTMVCLSAQGRKKLNWLLFCKVIFATEPLHGYDPNYFADHACMSVEASLGWQYVGSKLTAPCRDSFAKTIVCRLGPDFQICMLNMIEYMGRSCEMGHAVIHGY
jgi:hypothetical protein